MLFDEVYSSRFSACHVGPTNDWNDIIFIIIWLFYSWFITYAIVDECSHNMQSVNKNS